MVREEEHLGIPAQRSQLSQRRVGAVVIAIDQDVVQNHWHWAKLRNMHFDSSKAQREV